MVQYIKDTQQNQACGPENSECETESGEDFLGDGQVGSKTTSVSKPSFRQGREVEEYGCYAGTGDEERFEGLSADI